MRKISIMSLFREEQVQYLQQGFVIRVAEEGYADIFFKPSKYDIAGDEVGHYARACVEKQPQGWVLQEPYLLWSLLLGGVHPDVLQCLLQSHQELVQYVDLKRELQSWSAHERLHALPASPVVEWHSVVSLTMLAYCIIQQKGRYEQVLRLHGASVGSTVSIPKETSKALLSHVQANPVHMEELAKESQSGWYEYTSSEYATPDNQLIRKTEFTMSVFGDKGIEEAVITADVVFSGSDEEPDLNNLIMLEKDNAQQSWMRKAQSRIVDWQAGMSLTGERYVLHDKIFPSRIAVINKTGEWVVMQNITWLAYDMARDEILLFTSVEKQASPSLAPFADMPWTGRKDESNQSSPRWERQVYAERQEGEHEDEAFVAVERVYQNAVITTKRQPFFDSVTAKEGVRASGTSQAKRDRQEVFLSAGGRRFVGRGTMSVTEDKRWSVPIEAVSEMVVEKGGMGVKIRDKNEMRMVLCYGMEWLINPYRGLSCAELSRKVGLYAQEQQEVQRSSHNGAESASGAGFSPSFFPGCVDTQEHLANANKKESEKKPIASSPGVR